MQESGVRPQVFPFCLQTAAWDAVMPFFAGKTFLVRLQVWVVPDFLSRNKLDPLKHRIYLSPDVDFRA